MTATTEQKITPIDISALTPDQKKKLMQELEEQQIIEKALTRKKRATYKSTVDETVRELFPMLRKASELLAQCKTKVYRNMETLVAAKAELYEKETDQYSHSFTTSDGDITIIIGHNMIDGWDDTAETGIAKIYDYLNGLGKDRESKALSQGILKLLSKDSKGTLKASRVLQLKQMADETGVKTFIDAIQIIQDAYRPVRSKEFVRCEFKGEDGSKLILPLSITDAQKEA
jgi:hypothetical protein